MNSSRLMRPRLVLPFTVLTAPDTVRLVAGEDFRYTLSAPGLERWLPGLLARCDGCSSLDELLAELTGDCRVEAAEVIDRLYSERIVCDGSAEAAHVPARFRARPEGTSPLVSRLHVELPEADAEGAEIDEDAEIGDLELPILCQDRLDYAAALDFNRRSLMGDVPWLWVTHGPAGRGYASPLFLPGAGPCLACLLQQFRRLSPVGEIHDELIAHVRSGNEMTPVPFPEAALEILRQIVSWKLSMAARPDPPVALYRLHVVEADSLEVRLHRVFKLSDCSQCADRP